MESEGEKFYLMWSWRDLADHVHRAVQYVDEKTHDLGIPAAHHEVYLVRGAPHCKFCEAEAPRDAWKAIGYIPAKKGSEWPVAPTESATNSVSV